MPTFVVLSPRPKRREPDIERKGPLITPAISRTSARARPEPVSKVQLDAKETHRIVLARLDDIKAEDIVSINLTGKTSIADMMVVASGRSNRHVGSIADDVLEKLREAGAKNLHVEGMPHCDWVLIDAGDVIVHIFRPEVRSFYNLEKMWTTGPSAGKRAS
jgi:ribosome-associated protein